MATNLTSNNTFWLQIFNKETNKLEEMMKKLQIDLNKSSVDNDPWIPKRHEICRARFSED